MYVFFKNKIYISLLITSLLSIIPFVVLMLRMNDLSRVGDLDNINEQLINKVLSRTISSPNFLYPFILGLIVWIFSAITSTWSIINKKINNLYGYASLIMGGLGIHLILLIIYFVKDKHFRETKFNFRNKFLEITAFVSLPITLLIVFVTSMIASFQKTFDSPVVGAKIMYSLDKNNPNLIEIFTDGFDQWNLSDIQDQKLFKKFTWYKKFLTSGFQTHASVPSIYGGLKSNPFTILDKHGIREEEKGDVTNSLLWKMVYGNEFLEEGIKHLEVVKDKFSQINIVNPNTFSDNYLYGAVTSGVPSAIKKRAPRINVTNWSGARDNIVGKFGVMSKTPDNISYDFLTKHYGISTQSTKGARVYISDLITHKPFVMT